MMTEKEDSTVLTEMKLTLTKLFTKNFS